MMGQTTRWGGPLIEPDSGVDRRLQRQPLYLLSGT